MCMHGIDMVAKSLHTLESGIEVGPTVINLAFFSRPYGLIRDYRVANKFSDTLNELLW